MEDNNGGYNNDDDDDDVFSLNDTSRDNFGRVRVWRMTALLMSIGMICSFLHLVFSCFIVYK